MTGVKLLEILKERTELLKILQRENNDYKKELGEC